MFPQSYTWMTTVIVCHAEAKDHFKVVNVNDSGMLWLHLQQQ